MRRVRRVVLHVGTERTGSTSVQKALFAHRELLLSQGILVPLSILRSYELDAGVANHIPFVAALTDEEMFPQDLMPAELMPPDTTEAQWRAALVAGLRREVEMAPSNVDTVIISAEHIHSRLDTASAVIRMRELLASFADSTTVVAFLRPQIDMAVSLYNLVIRRGGVERRIVPAFDDEGGWDRVLGVRQSYFDLDAMLKRLEAAFGRDAILVHRYGGEVDFDSRKLVFAAGGAEFPEATTMQPARENASVSRTAQEALFFINRNREMFEDAHREFLVTIIDNVLLAKFPGPGVRPARSSAINFMNTFAAGNERIRQTYFPHDRELFPIDYTRFPERDDELRDMPESALVLLALLNEAMRR